MYPVWLGTLVLFCMVQVWLFLLFVPLFVFCFEQSCHAKPEVDKLRVAPDPKLEPWLSLNMAEHADSPSIVSIIRIVMTTILINFIIVIIAAAAAAAAAAVVVVVVIVIFVIRIVVISMIISLSIVKYL